MYYLGIVIQWHSVDWGINPPQKHPLYFAKSLPLNLQTVQTASPHTHTHFLAIPPIYWFFVFVFQSFNFFFFMNVLSDENISHLRKKIYLSDTIANL